MKSTTHYADLNELATGYFLNREVWWCVEAQAQFKEKARLVRESENQKAVMIQVERGRAMAELLRYRWLERTGKLFEPVETHWVARPGAIRKVLSNATKNHPADLIFRLDESQWLGVSAKSRDTKGEQSSISNPGLGTIEPMLGIWLTPIVTEAVDFAIRQYELPPAQDARKRAIRASKEIQTLTQGKGAEVAQHVRDTVFLGIVAPKHDKAPTFKTFVEFLLNAGSAILPKYIQLTGTGDGVVKPFAAELYDPYSVPLTDLSVTQAGNQAIGFMSGNHRICLLRVKWESEPLASTLKFSVDKWD